MFDYPPQSVFKTVLPKSKIYEYATAEQSKEAVSGQVQRIVWKYKLSPQTINIPATDSVPEIQIFTIRLRTRELSESILRCIDKSINFPIIFELLFEDEIMEVAAFKRRSESDTSQWVTGDYFWAEWVPSDTQREALPMSLDLGSLYQQMLWRLLPFDSLDGEAIPEQIEKSQRSATSRNKCRNQGKVKS